MILSVSRRTDIPAFYGQWFMKRLKEGYVLVRNPMNPRQVSRISLARELIDCIVFWTKNPRPLMQHLEVLKEYQVCFLFTVTPYGRDLEQNLPPKDEVMDTFVELSKKIGKERMAWRYDPIVMTETMNLDYHRKQFKAMAQRLESFTHRCIISFLDMYKKCRRNLQGIPIRLPGPAEMETLAMELAATGKNHGIELFSCAEDTDFSAVGVPPGGCIDAEWIGRFTGSNLDVKEDKHQRKTCRCAESIDIGAYNTCPHHCLYCYANADTPTVKKNLALHHPDSPLLLGKPSPEDTVSERNVQSHRSVQGKLF